MMRGKVRIQDLTKEESLEINQLIEELKKQNIAKAEDWFINDPHSFEDAHKKKITEIVLYELGISGGSSKRIGGTRILDSFKLDIFVEFYKKNQFIQFKQLRDKFPSLFNQSNNNRKRMMRNAILEYFREEFKSISNDDVIRHIEEKQITRIKDVTDVIYANLIESRVGLKKQIAKFLILKRAKKTKFTYWSKERNEFIGTYGSITPEGIAKFLVDNNVLNREHCLLKNRYVYEMIFFSKTQKYLQYVLDKKIWTEESVKKICRKKAKRPVLEIGNYFCERIRAENLEASVALFKVDNKLARHVDTQKKYWALKAYVMIHLGLLFTSKTNYMQTWDKERVLNFLSIMGLTHDSVLLPRFQEFLETRRIFL